MNFDVRISDRTAGGRGTRPTGAGAGRGALGSGRRGPPGPRTPAAPGMQLLWVWALQRPARAEAPCQRRALAGGGGRLLLPAPSARTTRRPPASTAASASPHVPDRKPHSRAAGRWVLDPIPCDGASFSPRLWEPVPFTPREQTPGRARAKARPFSPRSFAPGPVAAGATGMRDHSAATTLLLADGSKLRETLPGG